MNHLSADNGNQRAPLCVSGFTMVELLVVMAILVIFAAISGSLYFSGPTPAIRMQTGVAQAGALFNQARALAQGRHTSARVLISRDTEDPKKNLRYMVVMVRERKTEPGEPPRWEVAGNGIYLPQGIFHLPLPISSLMWDPVSRRDDEKNGKPWSSYNFGSSGHGGGGPFLLIAGARPPAGGETLTDDASVDGFLVRRNGYLTYFEHLDQIKQYLEAQEKK